MASGKAHARTTSTTLLLVTVVVFVALMPAQITAFVSGLAVGHYATPDVRDQHRQINEGERMVTAHYGWLAGRLWTLIWWLPARVIPHRSPLSHLPVFATTLAAVWLYWLPVALLWWYGYVMPWQLVAWHVAGWAIQDTVHLAQDNWRIKW